ncbi:MULTISPECIES: hypothetical protein [Streptomyces]|uniref:Uncharacterized protein n=4 Tax=Streptomyces TaxID=1883 RepID=A0ABW9IDF0_STRGJ|nr:MULTISPECIES: hypothetical protein [Streptomyces]MBP5861415.1 hypothetical protein [Streptomyces sp. LBUM 1484]MBP5869652.1 hypothetical protein [Streptomyces sp. LBUM 1485]MBP5908063.1 hypothetical protein [Streptomyces sp. LBUM 1478]MBP5928956.1 hypothetical protein [Streptomyces sp. LBUM 1479]KFG02907.1 hypothetical protein IQ61_43880 [Streptomyces scabiei]
MSRVKASTMDGDLQKVFGNPVPELYETAVGHDASPALARALELRSFLALTEEQVARVRDRVHADMDPDRDMGELSADKLHFDAQWLEAALDARDGYRAALGELLRTMPPPDQRARPVRTTQLRATATLPPSATPAPPRVGAAPASRP